MNHQKFKTRGRPKSDFVGSRVLLEGYHSSVYFLLVSSPCGVLGMSSAKRGGWVWGWDFKKPRR